LNTLKENGVTLTFVSIGDDEKLTKFLTLNPAIPTDRSFVDISATFDLYEAAGFRKIGDQTPDNLTVNLKPPNLGAKQWWSYLTNVAALAPVRKGEPVTGVPDGVLRLGGTFVLNGNDVLYAQAEELPGMSPEIKDVLALVM